MSNKKKDLPTGLWLRGKTYYARFRHGGELYRRRLSRDKATAIQLLNEWRASLDRQCVLDGVARGIGDKEIEERCDVLNRINEEIVERSQVLEGLKQSKKWVRKKIVQAWKLGEEIQFPELPPIPPPESVVLAQDKYKNKCGVYIGIDREGFAAYVGQSVNLGGRFRNHPQLIGCDVSVILMDETEIDATEIDFISALRPYRNSQTRDCWYDLGPKDREHFSDESMRDKI